MALINAHSAAAPDSQATARRQRGSFGGFQSAVSGAGGGRGGASSGTGGASSGTGGAGGTVPPQAAMTSFAVTASGSRPRAMFEFKAGADGKKRLLEVNPRVWGTYPLTRAAGTNFALLWLALAGGQPLPAYIPPKPVRMVFYPSDLAAALGYLRHGKPGRFLGAVRDLLRPSVKNGLYERADPGPSRAYRKNLRKRT